MLAHLGSRLLLFVVDSEGAQADVAAGGLGANGNSAVERGENGPNILRVYTDGRTHPAKEDLWPTYSGASVGHWEDDTLVFTTISMKGFSGKDVIVDRTGLILSDAARVTTRMRKIDDKTMEARMVIEDPKALTAPWTVVKRYTKQPPGTWGWDYSCAENNRNPISNSGRTLTLGPDGKPIDTVKD